MRTIGPNRIVIIHTFGLVEINVIVGVEEIEIWYSPEQRVRNCTRF